MTSSKMRAKMVSVFLLITTIVLSSNHVSATSNEYSISTMNDQVTRIEQDNSKQTSGADEKQRERIKTALMHYFANQNLAVQEGRRQQMLQDFQHQLEQRATRISRSSNSDLAPSVEEQLNVSGARQKLLDNLIRQLQSEVDREAKQAELLQSGAGSSSHKSIRTIQPVYMRLPPRFGRTKL